MSEGAPIGLLGGTFDPVHNGHLRIAIEAHEALALDHVRLIPLHRPGHRAAPLASPAQRLDMLRSIAVQPLVLETCEIARGGISYTVDTLHELRRRWPTRALCLLIGLDAWHGLPTWHRASELLQLAHIVVAARPPTGTRAHPALDEFPANAQAASVQELHQRPAGRVYFLDQPLLPIASSDLRQRCAAGRDIRHLVPDPVYDYIHRERLYRS